MKSQFTARTKSLLKLEIHKFSHAGRAFCLNHSTKQNAIKANRTKSIPLEIHKYTHGKLEVKRKDQYNSNCVVSKLTI